MKYVVPRQIKPGILKLTIKRGQNNFSIAFILTTFEVKGCYAPVNVNPRTPGRDIAGHLTSTHF